MRKVLQDYEFNKFTDDGQVRVKIEASDVPASTDGLTDTQLRAAPIEVTGDFYPATQPVSATTLPLPTGASTAALQSDANASLSNLDTKALTPGKLAKIRNANDRTHAVTYSDQGLQTERINTITFSSSSLGITATATYNYSLVNGVYYYTGMAWS